MKSARGKHGNNTTWGTEGEMPARWQNLFAGDGEPQATSDAGTLVESAPQSGEERRREHYGRKEERARVRNEEKTYDYKGLLISRWRGVAWGSGLKTGVTRGVSGSASVRVRDVTPVLAMWERPLEDLPSCMMPCTAQVRVPAAVSVGSALSLSWYYPAVWTHATRAAIFVPMVAFSFLPLPCLFVCLSVCLSVCMSR